MSQPTLNRAKTFSLRYILLLLSVTITAACGGGGGGTPASDGNSSSTTYSIGGTLTGLMSSPSGPANSILLRNNVNNDQILLSSNGNFTFPSIVEDGSNFGIEIGNQPNQPAQTCTVSNANGTVNGGDITNISVQCDAALSVGGMVSGLTGTGLVLQNNAGDNLAINANGAFTFNTLLPDKSVFDVTILSQPTNPAQTCSIQQGRNTLAGRNYTEVQVQCAPWQKVNPYTETQNTLLSLAYNGTIRVTVGTLGEILTSTDGATWVRQKPVTTSTLEEVIWSPQDSQFIAVGRQGSIITSNDGINWQRQQSGVNDTIRSITWRAAQNTGDIQYVATGYELDSSASTSTAFILTSPDGINWTQQLKLAPNSSFLDASSNSQRFVVIGVSGNGNSYEGIAYTSEDGVTWTQQTAGLQNSNTIYGITWSNRDNQFVALGYDVSYTSISYISTDGITWVASIQTQNPVLSLTDVMFLNNQYIANGYNGVYTSDDGISWTIQASATPFGFYAEGVGWDGNQYFAVGSSGFILSSPDTQNWTVQNALTMNSINAVAAHPDRNEYLFFADNNRFSSTDGLSWAKTDAGTTETIFDIISIANDPAYQYMAVGSNGVIFEFIAGRWNGQRTRPSINYSLRGVAFNQNSQAREFVAVGGGGTILLLKNRPILGGSSFIWEAENSGTTAMLTSVIWSGNQYVAVGDTILTSPNGESWTTRSRPTTTRINDIVWGNGLFVAVGSTGGIITSVDGQNWNVIPNTAQYNLGAIAWNGINGAGSEYVAVDSSISEEYVLRSPDGVTWTQEILPPNTFGLRDIAWNSTQQKYILVGSLGSIYLSQ